MSSSSSGSIATDKLASYDLNAVGVYKESPEEGNLDLTGHVPIELSRVLAGFLAASETNSLTVKVCSWMLPS